MTAAHEKVELGTKQKVVYDIDLPFFEEDVLLSEYKVDGDPDYQPQADAESYCYILAPFCE